MLINRIRLEFKEELPEKEILERAVLIESDWNLKHKEDRHRFPGCRRINRIRLEFKAEGQTAGLLGI